MPIIPDLKTLLKAGVHFGHSVGRWHPKADWYIHSARNGVHIIDLEITQSKLEEALSVVHDTAKEGKTILFVGTKRQAQKLVEDEAKRAGMPYITERWLGGLLTNFDGMKPMLDNFRKLIEDRDSGAWEKYTKKERVRFEKLIQKKDGLLRGIKGLLNKPDMLFLLDIRKEKTAYNEAQALGIPVVALCDTNVNPENVKYPIPANDDAVKSLKLITSLVADAIIEGKGSAPINRQEKVTDKEETKPVESSKDAVPEQTKLKLDESSKEDEDTPKADMSKKKVLTKNKQKTREKVLA